MAERNIGDKVTLAADAEAVRLPDGGWLVPGHTYEVTAEHMDIWRRLDSDKKLSEPLPGVPPRAPTIEPPLPPKGAKVGVLTEEERFPSRGDNAEKLAGTPTSSPQTKKET